MPETKNNLEVFINETINSLESFGEALNLEKSFFRLLLSEDDDWAFLVKTHTLVETSLSHLINEELDRKKLSPVIEKLNIDGRVSKLAFIEALSLLDKPQIDYIRQLSTLRNIASHSIQSISVPLKVQVSEMSAENLKKLMVFPVKNDKLLEFVKREPRFVIWSSAMQLLERIYNKKQEIIRQRFFSPTFVSDKSHPIIKGLLG